MNIYFEIDDINIDNIYFFKPANNNIIENAFFHRTIYSNKLLTLNAIFIKINIKIDNIENFYTKYKFNFTINDNIDTINKIINNENKILDKFLINNEHLKKKEKTHELYNVLNKSNFKMYTNKINKHLKNEFILKISGFWETSKKYGLTYKFIDIVNKN